MPDYGSGTIGAWQNQAHGIEGDPATADVLIIGDSITTRGKDELAAALALHGKSLAVNYWSGRPLTPAVDWLVSLPQVAETVIIADFANDVFDPSVVGDQLDRVINANLPGCSNLFFMDAQVCRPAYAVADQRNSGWINNQIREAVADDVSAQVIPWSQWFASDPTRLPRYLDAGGVHTIEGIGTRFWAEVIMRLLRPLWL